jgi:hypothetical protein
MVSLETRKRELLSYVLQRMPDVERGLEVYSRDNPLGYQSLHEFQKGQQAAISNLTEAEVLTFEGIQKLAPKMHVMDEESWCAFNLGGFCFRSDGECVIFNYQ